MFLTSVSVLQCWSVLVKSYLMSTGCDQKRFMLVWLVLSEILAKGHCPDVTSVG